MLFYGITHFTPNTLHTMKKQALTFTYKKAFVSRGLEFINLQPYHQNLDEINQIGDSTSLHFEAGKKRFDNLCANFFIFQYFSSQDFLKLHRILAEELQKL